MAKEESRRREKRREERHESKEERRRRERRREERYEEERRRASEERKRLERHEERRRRESEERREEERRRRESEERRRRESEERRRRASEERRREEERHEARKRRASEDRRREKRHEGKRRRVVEDKRERKKEKEEEEEYVEVKKKKIVGLEEGLEVLENGLSKLKRILEGVPDTQFTTEEYMTQYTTVYNMCTQTGAENNHAEPLYDKYNKIIEDYLTSVALPSIQAKHGEFILKELLYRWSNHKTMSRWLYHFFHYLDRYFISRKNLQCLKDVALICFRDLVYKHVNSKARDLLLSMVEHEREGGQVDRSLLKNVVHIFIEMGTTQDQLNQSQSNNTTAKVSEELLMQYYLHDFEVSMIKETSNYYNKKASIWIEQDSCPTYMIKVEECLKQEKERVSHYLHHTTEKKLLKEVEHQLLAVYANQLLEKEHSGCLALLRDDKVEDLSRMYTLFSKITNGLEAVSAFFKQHVLAQGTALVTQAVEAASNNKKDAVAASLQYLRKVIELHDKYLDYVKKYYASHTLFHKALKEAFEVFCNKEIAGSSNAEVLASFLDNILNKGGSEKLTDEAIEETLDKVVKLLAYISDKDLFAEFCRKKLARRLLFDRSASDEHERSILTRLKQQWGGQFTSKMEGMVTDLTLAREHQNNFAQHLRSNPRAVSGIDLSVTVLTTGFWPTYKTSDLRLPAEMVKCVEAFNDYYQINHYKKKLTWIYSLGSCNITGKFKQKPIELIVTTFQACVLLLFNASDRLSYSEIKDQLNLTDDDITRLLHSLSCAKYKILNKEPNTKTISSKDIFEFNSEFTDRMRRIRIPLPPLDEKKKVVEEVNKDRSYNIDASIVRIMKSRKVLSHQELIVECVKQLASTFKPDMKVIKKRIEDLIARDYMERDAADPKIYKYIA